MTDVEKIAWATLAHIQNEAARLEQAAAALRAQAEQLHRTLDPPDK